MNIEEYIRSGIIESCVMGIADEQEQALLRDLRIKYPEVEIAFIATEKWMEEESMAGAIPVPEIAGEKIWTAVLQYLQPEGEVKHLNEEIEIVPIKRFRQLRLVAAASIILFLCTTSLSYYYYKQYRNTKQEYLTLLLDQQTAKNQEIINRTNIQILTDQVIQLKDTSLERIILNGTKGKEENKVTLFWNKRTHEVMLDIMSLNNIPPGKQYQLWAIVNNKPLNAGILQNCASFCRLGLISSAQAFAITLEPAGGSKEPTLKDMIVIGFVKS